MFRPRWTSDAWAADAPWRWGCKGIYEATALISSSPRDVTFRRSRTNEQCKLSEASLTKVAEETRKKCKQLKPINVTRRHPGPENLFLIMTGSTPSHKVVERVLKPCDQTLWLHCASFDSSSSNCVGAPQITRYAKNQLLLSFVHQSNWWNTES